MDEAQQALQGVRDLREDAVGVYLQEMIPKRIRERVVTAQFTAEQMAAVDRQTQDILHFHITGFSASKDIDSQMWALARDCYIQGLLDGNQVRPVVDAMRNKDGDIK